MSHERHGVPDHWSFECLLNNSFGLTSENNQLTLLTLCWRKPPVTGGFPSQRASDVEKVSIWWSLHALFIFVSKWFCKELILKSMKVHCRKIYHNDYVTKQTRSVYKYPGNPFVTLRAHPLHPAGGSQLFCTYEVVALRKRPRREQRKQRVADLLTSIEHCLFDGSSVMCIFCDITHMPLWYSLKRVVAVNNMGWSAKVRGCIYAPVNCLIIGSIRDMYGVMAWCPFGFDGYHCPKQITMSIFIQGNDSTHAQLSQMFSLKGMNFILTCQQVQSRMCWRLQASRRFIREEQQISAADVQLCSSKKCPEMVEELTCNRDAGDRTTRNSSNLFWD